MAMEGEEHRRERELDHSAVSIAYQEMLSVRNRQWQIVQKFFHNRGLPKFSVQVIHCVTLRKHPLSSGNYLLHTLLTTLVWEVSEKKMRGCSTSVSEKAGERWVRHRVQKALEIRSRDVHVIVRRSLYIQSIWKREWVSLYKSQGHYTPELYLIS